jgi:hypothetical protein
MRQQAPATAPPRVPQQRAAAEGAAKPTAWAGWVMFGAIMMIVAGAFHAIAGLVALLNSGYYLVGANGFVLNINFTAWGWAHLAIGVAALVAGFGLFTGAMWARVLGVTVAAISLVANFVFIPAFPLWCLTMVALDVIVIYAIVAHGREVQQL